jgi:outer membrane protein TolC
MRAALLTLAALAASLFTSTSAAAQTLVTLTEAVAAALDRNPALRAMAAGVDEAEARADAARAAWFPEVSVSESWQRSNQPVFAFSALLAARAFTEADFATSRLNSPEAVSAMSGRVLVRQVLFDRRTGAGVALDAARHDVARAALDEQRAAVALEVTESYGHLLVAVAAESAASAAAAAAREDVLRAERRRDAGLATDADVLAFSVHAAAMDRRRIAATGAVTVGRAELNRLTGQPVDRSVTVEAPPLPADEAQPVDVLLRQAEEARPELRRRAAERRAADAGRLLAGAVWQPRVTAQAGYQVDGLDVFDRAGSWIVGGDVSWSMSLGGAERARSRAARAALSAADARTDDTRAALHLDVMTAVSALETARARVNAGARAVAEATERERITRNRYDAGLAGATDVLAAAAATLDADTERVTALVDAIVAHAMLNRALGRPAEGRQP